MGDRKLGFKKENIPEKVAAVLGVKPKSRSPLTENVRKVEILSLLNVTKVIENNDYENICGALEELKKGNISDVEFVAENTNSIDVCMAILNEDYPEDVKKIAEKRIAKIGSEFKAIYGICNKIRKLEHEMRNGYFSVNESVELLQANIELGEEIKKLEIRDLYELAAGSVSVHICQAITYGEYPDDLKAIAESRIGQIRTRYSTWQWA